MLHQVCYSYVGMLVHQLSSFLLMTLINLDFPADSQPSKTKPSSPSASKRNIYYKPHSAIALIADSRPCAFLSHLAFMPAQWTLCLQVQGVYSFPPLTTPASDQLQGCSFSAPDKLNWRDKTNIISFEGTFTAH